MDGKKRQSIIYPTSEWAPQYQDLKKQSRKFM